MQVGFQTGSYLVLTFQCVSQMQKCGFVCTLCFSLFGGFGQAIDRFSRIRESASIPEMVGGKRGRCAECEPVLEIR
jgi:hypothetical protein